MIDEQAASLNYHNMIKVLKKCKPQRRNDRPMWTKIHVHELLLNDDIISCDVTVN